MKVYRRSDLYQREPLRWRAELRSYLIGGLIVCGLMFGLWLAAWLAS